MTIIDFQEAKIRREPHMAGEARCLVCQHTWVAVAPVGTIWMTCPKCTALRGLMEGVPIRPNLRVMTCQQCQGQMFYFGEDGKLYCVTCACWYDT